MRRVQAEIKSVEKSKEGGWHVGMKSCSTGRILFMITTRSGYCRGQTVKLTCETVSQEGELLNPRFNAWVPFLYSRKGDLINQEKALIEFLKNFRQGCGLKKSCGRVHLEKDIEVEIDRRGWFLVYRAGTKDRVMSVCHARSLAKKLVEGMV